ncbi:MAG TPA: methyltransferase domain-containing protein [Kofleriaceae bacterium]|nr:methyltransferase domain-containing protein [Kofleriaceae bacterium]
MCKPTPGQIHIEQTAAFAADSLRGRPRVLELGSRGELATRLASLGFSVTTFRDGEPSAGVTRLDTDLSTYEGDPFDAIAMTNVLQREQDLDAFLDDVYAHLKPGGRLIIEELDVTAPDVRTLRWYYDAIARITLAMPTADADVEVCWGAEWSGCHLHGASRIEQAVTRRFSIRSLHRVEYLYREVARRLLDTDEGRRIALALRQIERQKVADGSIVATGIQLVADRSPETRAAVCGARLTAEVSCGLAPGHDGLHQWRGPNGQTFDWG